LATLDGGRSSAKKRAKRTKKKSARKRAVNAFFRLSPPPFSTLLSKKMPFVMPNSYSAPGSEDGMDIAALDPGNLKWLYLIHLTERLADSPLHFARHCARGTSPAGDVEKEALAKMRQVLQDEAGKDIVALSGGGNDNFISAFLVDSFMNMALERSRILKDRLEIKTMRQEEALMGALNSGQRMAATFSAQLEGSALVQVKERLAMNLDELTESKSSFSPQQLQVLKSKMLVTVDGKVKLSPVVRVDFLLGIGTAERFFVHCPFDPANHSKCPLLTAFTLLLTPLLPYSSEQPAKISASSAGEWQATPATRTR
jgi:hypothetical protein